MTRPISDTRLTVIGDHAERLRDRVSKRRWWGPRIDALLGACGHVLQQHEEQKFDILSGRVLQAATGAQLEQWGELVGEERGVLRDDEYRRFIAARILANRCTGDVDGLLTVFSTVTGPHQGVRHEDFFPAGFAFWVARDRFMRQPVRRRVGRLMRTIKPGGVSMVLIEALAEGAGFGTPWTGHGAGGLARLIS